MKKKSMLLSFIVALIMAIGISYGLDYKEAKADIPPDVCSMYVPAFQDCTWYPVNCLCTIVVTG